MKPTTNGLRRHYQNLETTELLNLLDSGELTAAALAALREAIEARDSNELLNLLQRGWPRASTSAILQEVLASRGIAAKTFKQRLAPDFETFLRETATQRPLDRFGNRMEPLFSPESDVTEADIQAQEERIGSTLPSGYKLFLRVLGSGIWCHVYVLSPAEIYVYDDPCLSEMTNIVGIVADGAGNYFAFNPADPEDEGERPLYYCCHDPFGYARAADSFDSWARNAAVLTMRGEYIYRQFDDAVYRKWEEYTARQPKRWWQFWK